MVKVEKREKNWKLWLMLAALYVTYGQGYEEDLFVKLNRS